MQITSVERSRKNQGKFLVYIDGSYAFSISEEDYLSLNLYEEKEMTKEDIDHIKNVVNYRAAKYAAVKYLSLKFRSNNEVAAKLDRDGFDQETIEKVLDELKSTGYVNDRVYVQKYICDRIKLKPKSKKMLKLELLRRGVDAKIIDGILKEWEIDEPLMAENLVKRKFCKYDLNEEKVVKRIYAFLQHRGFSLDLIERVIGKLREENS